MIGLTIHLLGVYTRITEYDEWIKETIAKDVF